MRFVPALLLSLFLAPGAARAVEAVLGVMGETGYNSNIFYQSTNEQGDGSARFGPIFELRDRTGQLTWSLDYEPSYQVFYTQRGINSVYHQARAELSWQPSIATEFYANDTFSDTPIFSSTFQTNQQGLLAQPVPVFTNSDVIQNFATVGVRHAFSPRWLGEIALSSSIVDYQESLFFDSSASMGQAFVTYGWTPRDRIGSGISGTRQKFSGPNDASGGSNYYQLFGIWTHDFSPTWSFSLNAGPTLVQPDSTSFETSRNAPIYSRELPLPSGTILTPLAGATCIPFEGVLVAEQCGNLFNAQGALSANQVLAFDPVTGARIDLGQLGTLQQLGSVPKAGTSLTYFANVSMTKHWQTFDLTGSYVRNATNTSGFGQSLVTDTFTLTPVWHPTSLWSVYVTALYIRRQSTTDQSFNLTPVRLQTANACSLAGPAAGGNQLLLNQCLIDLGTGQLVDLQQLQLAQARGLQAFTVNSGLKIENYGISAQVNRRITRNAYVYGRASYEYQTNKRTGFSSVTVDRYIVTVGVRYEFEPFHFLN